MTENPAPPTKIPANYVDMFEQYISGQDWIGAAELPLVFHLRQLCTQLDAASTEAKAAQSSAYLQAFSRLDRRRPGAPPPVTGSHPDQTTIFDHMD